MRKSVFKESTRVNEKIKSAIERKIDVLTYHFALLHKVTITLINNGFRLCFSFKITD